jgi:uncharacterized protein (DUF2236 family)
MAFGTASASAAATSNLAHVHRRVVGSSDEGLPYSAGDPGLLLWVFATLIDTTVCLYNRCVRQLDRNELDLLYSEQKRFAEACGLPRSACPSDWGDFESYFNDVIERDLRVTPIAKSVADSVLRPGPRLLRPLFTLNAIVTIELLPGRLRDAYEFPPAMRRPQLAGNVLESMRISSRLVPGIIRRAPVSALAALPERFAAKAILQRPFSSSK